MVTIAEIHVATATVPLAMRTSLSNRTITRREYTLVRVRGSDGVSGIGFCYAGHTGGILTSTAALELLGPFLLGRDAHLTSGAWQAMYHEVLLHGRAGSVMRALSALDIALWDRNSRAAGLPLHRYLGGIRDSVPAYASGGYYRDGDQIQAIHDEMAGYVRQGFTAFKMKVGRVDPGLDTDRIAAARDAIGPAGILMLDANNAWSDLVTALRSIRLWERYDPYLIEEPFSPDDIDNHARLARATAIAVATGEIEAGHWRVKQLLEARAVHILQSDAAVCGGITELRNIASLADAFGIPLAPHWFHDLHAPLVAALPNAIYVEYFPNCDVLNFRSLIDRQLGTDHGSLLLHSEPGLGFDFDPAAIERYASDGWIRVTSPVTA